MADVTSAIKVHVKTIGANDPALPPLVLQVTQMVDTYMLWIGAVENISDIGTGENAVLAGNLCKDWACAMPATTVRTSVANETRAKGRAGLRQPGRTPAATSLFRSSNSDVALSMAQRLAKRFQKQIFLSVDIPTGFSSNGQGDKLLFEAEKGIVGALKEIESRSEGSKEQ